jgi:hypothetical protein
MKKFLSGILAVTLVASLTVPAFAIQLSEAGEATVPVELTVTAATFSVTVPTALPVTVDATGVVTTATDAKIVNNSHGAVRVTNMVISGVDDWEIVNYDSANMSAEKANSHKVAIQINGDKTTADDTITFTESNFPKLDGANATDSDELEIVYDAKLPAQTTQISGSAIANVVFTVGWDA